MKKILFLARMLLSVCLVLSLSAAFASCGDEETEDQVYVTVVIAMDNSSTFRSHSPRPDMKIDVSYKTGHDFIGYFTEDGTQLFDKDGRLINGLLIEKSVTVYPRFQPHKMTVVFSGGEGQLAGGVPTVSVEARPGDTVAVEAPTPISEKYVFDGWYTEDEVLCEYSDGMLKVPEAVDEEGDGIRITAKYKVKTFTVTLNYNDGITDSKALTVEWGESIDDLSEHYISREGMDVVGWSALSYTEATYDPIVKADITLFAMWKKYKVTEFVYPRGEVKELKVYYNPGESAPLPADVRVPGYDLEGWYSSDLYYGTPIESVPGDAIAERYYGKWVVAKYELTFDTLGAGELEPMEYYYGDTEKLPTPELIGNTFEGWQAEGLEGTLFTIPAELWGDYTLTAVWTPVPYVIDLNCFGGVASSTFATVYYGNHYVLPVPTRDGYSFKGWYLGEERYTDAHGNSLEAFTGAEDLTLSALWEVATFTVRYETNGGIAIPLDRYEYNSTLILPEDPRKEGEMFLGWFDETFTTEYTCLTKVTGDLTLYAQYVVSTPISSPEDFYNIRNNPTGNYHLINDINLRGENVSPMPEFKGVLNGQGYKIHNFAINASGTEVGLFVANSGIIRNLIIDNCNVNITYTFERYNGSNYDWVSATADCRYGILVARNSGVILGCKVTGSTIRADLTTFANHKGDDDISSGTSISSTMAIGGLVGRLDPGGRMYFCENDATVSVTASVRESGDAAASGQVIAGGIVGSAYSSTVIANCSSIGSVTVSTSSSGAKVNSKYDNSGLGLYNYVAGIAGYNEGSIFQCVSYSDVLSNSSQSTSGYPSGLAANKNMVAAICGQNRGIITACVGDGNVAGFASKALMIGSIAGWMASGSKVEDCIAYSTITGNGCTSGNAGGIVGGSGGLLKTSAFFGNLIAASGSGNIGGIVGYNEASGSVMSCVNFGSITASYGAPQAALGWGHGISNGNVFDETAEITLNGEPRPSTPDSGAKSATREQLTSESFYHEVLYWETENWAIEDGKLPYLRWYGEWEDPDEGENTEGESTEEDSTENADS